MKDTSLDHSRSPCSNRTFMELKLPVKVSFDLAAACSNRTFMELKCGTYWKHDRGVHVLIVPLWN